MRKKTNSLPLIKVSRNLKHDSNPIGHQGVAKIQSSETLLKLRTNFASSSRIARENVTGREHVEVDIV